MRLAVCHALCADPPWKFGDSLPGPSRGAAKNYPTLSVDELMHFRLPPIADDALLFLWRVASMQQEALDVGKAWGFELKTEIVWNKLTKTGKPWFGMGRITRAAHETCLVFKRGRPVIMNKSIRSTFEAPVTEHSGKPDEFFRIVERLVDGPYTELFSRKRRAGWQCLGNEVDARLPKPENPGSQKPIPGRGPASKLIGLDEFVQQQDFVDDSLFSDGSS